MNHAIHGSVAESLPSGGAELLHNLVLFGRALRRAGIAVSPGQLGECARALPLIDLGLRQDVRETLRSLLVSKHNDLAVFDQIFDLFWRTDWPLLIEGDVPPEYELLPDLTSGGIEEPRQGGVVTIDRSAGGNAPPGEEMLLALYSAGEVLRHKDFSRLTSQELADAQRFLASMRWAIMQRRSRRLRPKRDGRNLDLRRSMRNNLRHGGEMLSLVRRGPKRKRRQLVLLCDISGSMDRYTRLLLHFLYSVESSLRRTEVFVFSTRLTRVTHDLRHRDPDEALAAVTASVHDWSGGTRIGDALRTFNRLWARRVLGQGAIVLVISDGWDRGDPQVLAAEMARLQRSSYRLLWLNPLLGSPGYRPLTQGMQAALPYVDDFLPVHNLASLEALGHLLNRVQEHRPSRQQWIRPLSRQE